MQNVSDDSAKDVKKVAKGAGISFIGSVTGRCLWLLCQVIVARYFNAEVFGLYTLGLMVLKIAELIARFGLHAGAMRFVSIYRKDAPGKVKGIFISASLISFVNGLLLAGIVYFFADFISGTIFHKPTLTEIIKSFTPCIPFMATMMVVAVASQGFHTTKYAVYIKDIIQPSVNIICIIPFILLGFGISGVISAFIISHAVALLAGFFFITGQFSRIKERTVKPVYETWRLLRYSAPLLFNGFLIFLISWTATIMLGYMKTSADVGIYRAASQIPIIFSLILTASNSIYAPAVAEMHHHGHMERLEKIFKMTTRWVFLVTLPVTVILIFSAREVMSLFGSHYVETGALVLIVLAIAQFINAVTGGVAFTLSMTGKQNIEMLNSFAMVVMNIILNYFLIPEYGSLGAAIATGISIGAINLIRLLEVYILYKVHPYNLGYIQGVASGVIAVASLYFLGGHLQNYSHAIRLIANSLVVCIIFVIPFIIRGLRDEDRFVFDAVAKKFKYKIRVSKV
ncbi:MAG: hypothetical protein UZ01_02763 [Candidatus Brocadia sinica]|nr:MAG: hypothetical protein UZ01_02763 [Candidatus Brocadia sinica]